MFLGVCIIVPPFVMVSFQVNAGPGKASMVRDRRFVFLPDTCRAALRSHKNLPVLVHPFGLPRPHGSNPGPFVG
jgi:hypothetical protein